MSLSPGFEVHQLKIERLAVTQDSVGGQIREYSQANRGSLPTMVKARAIIMRPDERLEHGVRGECDSWKFLIPRNPSITLEDRIRFTFRSGEAERIVKVIVASHARSVGADFWRCIGEEDTTKR